MHDVGRSGGMSASAGTGFAPAGNADVVDTFELE
jgi:hypothetical protein